jgi:hypothetical protein
MDCGRDGRFPGELPGFRQPAPIEAFNPIQALVPAHAGTQLWRTAAFPLVGGPDGTAVLAPLTAACRNGVRCHKYSR